MVFLGLERPIEYQRQQIFDPTMAKMVLDAQDSYFNAVYNDYQQGVQDMKEFNKNYGDFLTQITKDQDWWNKNVTDKVHGFIADAYSRGIDLLRTPEGRAAVTQIINSMPYGEMAKKRVRAENAKEYYKAAGVLAAQNKYDKDFAMFLGEDPNQWADDYMGITAPTQFQTLKEATNDWYNNRTPRSATDKEKKELGLDRRYDWKMFSDEDLMNIARDQTPGWQNSPQARYYRDLAKKQLQAEGNAEPSSNEIEARLQRNIASAQQEWLVKPVKGTADQFAVLAQQQANAKEMARINHEYAMDLQGLKNDGKGGNGGTKEGTSYGMTLLGRGIQKWAGSADPGKAGLDRAKEFGAALSNMDYRTKSGAYVNFYGMNEAESTASWTARFSKDPSRIKDAGVGAVNYVSSIDNKKLYSEAEMTSGTLYYPGPTLSHLHKKIDANATMVPTGRVYTAPMQNGTYQQFVEVEVGTGANNYRRYWYKVTETQASPAIPSGDYEATRAPWQTGERYDKVFAPDGFSVIPNDESANQWSIMDSELNKAAGLASDPTKAIQGQILDNVTWQRKTED